jgi:hypothetical protein
MIIVGQGTAVEWYQEVRDETGVGIREYVAHDLPQLFQRHGSEVCSQPSQVTGIIKSRNLGGQLIHENGHRRQV